MIRKIINRLRASLKDVAWKPDWSNPDDIRRIVIHYPGKYFIKFVAGWVILGSCVVEIIALFIGLPFILEYFDDNPARLPEWIAHIGPLVMLFNGLLLAVVAASKGINFISNEQG